MRDLGVQGAWSCSEVVGKGLKGVQWVSGYGRFGSGCVAVGLGEMLALKDGRGGQWS